MHNGEWSLISFTLLSQLSVGLVLALGFVFFMHNSIFENLSSGFNFRAPELIILILVLLATLLSLLHLGSPLHSFHSLNNLKGSWISREILMLSVFGLGVLLFILSRMFNWPIILTQILLVFSMLSGVTLVSSMAGIYLIPTVPVWNNFYTPVSFLGSALLLGTLAMVILLIRVNPHEISPDLMKQLIVFILIILAVTLVFAALHQYQISQFKFTGIDQIEFSKGWRFILFILRMFLLLVTLSGTVYLLWFNSSPATTRFTEIQNFLFLLSIIILSEEILGRFLFYSSYFRLGV